MVSRRQSGRRAPSETVAGDETKGVNVMSEKSTLPQPDRALERVDRLVGTWSMEGSFVGSDEATIHGETTFSCCPAARPRHS
jgi:hypothetical protein